MRILIFAPSFAPAVKAGGPARSITNLAVAAATEHEVVVVAADRDLGDERPFPGLSGRRVTSGNMSVHFVDQSSARQWRTLLRRLHGKPFDLILLNSLWHRSLGILPAALVLARIISGPVVLMPRGELEQGALALNRGRKRLAGPVLRALYRRTLSAVGSTSTSEARASSEWLPGVPILLTTNEPEAVPFGVPDSPSRWLRVVVLGRIHPKKGLLQLLQGLRTTRTMIRVTVRGPVEPSGYWEVCETLADELPPNVQFVYEGVADRDEIPRTLWNSDCMAFLTAGENYGHVIAEALQAGCPVITTPTTPWTEVIREGGGSVITDRDDAEEVGRVLDQWGSRTDAELMIARENARNAFERFRAYAPANIVDQALALFQKNDQEVS